MSIPGSRLKNLSRGWMAGSLVVSFVLLSCRGAPELPIEQPRQLLPGRLADLSWEAQQELMDDAAADDPEESRKKLRARTAGDRDADAERGPDQVLRQSVATALSSGRFDRAVADLESAVEARPESADLFSDLAAVRLWRGQTQSDPYDDILALKAADHALSLDPAHLPARFNRALALTQIRLLVPAQDAWASYLQEEKDLTWCQEARRRQVSIQLPEAIEEDLGAAFDRAAERGDEPGMESAVRRSPRFFREYAGEVLLAAWGKAVVRGDEIEASQTLRHVRQISDALASVQDDSTLAQTIGQIERAQTQAPKEFARIARGLDAYRRGLALAAGESSEAALALFARAEKILSQADSPFAAWASFQVAVCHFRRNRYGEATRVLKSLASALSSEQRAVHGRAMSLLGLIELVQGNSAIALRRFEMAREDFRGLSESSHEIKQQALIASTFGYLGQHREAWRQLHAALLTEERFDIPFDQKTPTRVLGSWLAIEEDAPRIALLFQEEVLRAAHRLNQPSAVVEALRGRAGILEAMGRKEEAQEDLREARTINAEIEDKEMAGAIEGDIALIEGMIACDGSPAEALAHFDLAIDSFRSTSYFYRLVLALLERARLLIALGRPALAERDLLEAINESERQRKAIESASHRISYYDQIRALLDLMIDLQLRAFGNPARALEFSERARGRVLWDWLKIQPAPGALPADVEAALAPSRLEPWRCELPPASLVVEYAVLGERVAIWSMDDCSQTVATTVEISAAELTTLVEEFRESIYRRKIDRSKELAAQLYDLLIRPFATQLKPGQALVLIPDGPLHGLPFSLLQEKTTGRRLVQDHAVSMAPSLRILSAGLRRDREMAQDGPPRALIVTDPEIARGFHRLPRLPAGDVEASIAGFFPGSQVLVDNEATKKAFLAKSREVEILHFGGHSVVNSEAPLLSYLLFAPDADDPSGALYSRDLLKQRFPSIRLAVLASCDSGIGKISRTEGVESLARPFLAAGIPGVIASLWPVEDRSTADFFVRFYRKLAETGNVAESLRATQIELLELDSKGWETQTAGAFVYIGTSFTQ